MRSLLTCFLSFLIFQSKSFAITDHTKASQAAYEVSVLGAPVTGALVEGVVGSIQKGCRHRFYCHSSHATQGFLGPQTVVEPLSIKDQPGVFPAPLMGSATLTFRFSCQESSVPFTPIIIRPDGTVFHGQQTTATSSPETLVIAAPAQTGIYTLFILTDKQDEKPAQALVEASISTHPQEIKFLQLKSFEANDEEGAERVSAEFVYIPFR